MTADVNCLEGLRVAVVEDEAMIAMLIEDVLLDIGSEVVGIGRSVAEALDLIERERPDAVTLDGNLDGQLSGPVAERCQQLSIRYLVVTGYVDRTLRDPVLAAGPRLPKPFTRSTLVRAAVEHLC